MERAGEQVVGEVLVALLGVGLGLQASVDLLRQQHPRPPRNDTFVSATFHVDVARAHSDGHGDRATTGVLLRQVVPLERLFMTYLGTGAMNRH